MCPMPGPILLINPNTNAEDTEMMCGIAQHYLDGSGFDVRGGTVARGVHTIAELGQLSQSIPYVVAETRRQMQVGRPTQGVIISAFGDPGLVELRQTLRIPVVGLGESSVKAAATLGSFAVVNATGHLETELAAHVKELPGGENYVGMAFTQVPAPDLPGSPDREYEELYVACEYARDKWNPDAIIIGGGPLSESAERLLDRFSTPIVAPIRAAVHDLLQKLGVTTDTSVDVYL